MDMLNFALGHYSCFDNVNNFNLNVLICKADFDKMHLYSVAIMSNPLMINYRISSTYTDGIQVIFLYCCLDCPTHTNQLIAWHVTNLMFMEVF